MPKSPKKKLHCQVAELCDGAEMRDVLKVITTLTAGVTQQLDDQGKLEFAQALLSGIFQSEVAIEKIGTASTIH